MAPCVANVGSAARAGAARQEAEEDDVVDTVEEMYGRAVREYEGLGTSRISSEATSSAAHNLPVSPPTLSVPPLSGDTVASAQATQPNSFVSGAHAPAALPSLGRGHALTSSSGLAHGSGLAAAYATSAAVPPQEESGMETWRRSRVEFGVGGDWGLEIMEGGTAHVVQHVCGPQASVVYVLDRSQQGQAEEGYEEGEEEDDSERGRDVGVALTSVDDEVEFDDDESMGDQATEEATAQVARDQRRNRRLGRAHFTSEEIQSFLSPPDLTPEAAEAPSNSPPPSLPAPSATGAPASVAAPIVPSLGSPLTSADSQGFLAAAHPRVPPVSHAPGVGPYHISEHAAPIRAVGNQGLETVPYQSDAGHRAALSDDEVPQVPRLVGRSGFGLPRHFTSGNFFDPAARSGRTDKGRPSSLPDVDVSEDGGKGGKGKKDVVKKSQRFWPSFTGRKGGKGKKKKDRDNEAG
ncbi:hypothetical protein NEUTE1DRAFT_149651 [Neurospora tetrasperma FGSC 2508]|uniref:Uncharacterized protein n=1 Tax=Neurospora tetrasperma (strain FGSC 2508 / ATCC MYA-4615 / P0657) TaxID=510951 RepID=F8MZD7_NEUT8|nr:uncharacterized protein NEUTE1DRAFT_149651 [Neurospora tetrasperma FGSC 2508]EGO52028.1 hypothetical protein NEUTE1DRAFT_149651 [Neurospora tetrasperma FGSC 2508]